MIPALTLWLPVLLAAVAVFIASWLIHVLLGYHKHDYKAFPDEDAVADALRPFNLAPGEYTLPHCTSHKDMASPEFLEKLKRGPVGMFTICPNAAPAIGKSLVLWFLYCVLVGLFAAYLTGLALEPGAGFSTVLRVSATVAFAGYGLALLQDSIWFGRGWPATGRNLLDSLIYALLTGAVFGSLWPAA